MRNRLIPKEPLLFKQLNINGQETKCLCASYSQIEVFLQCPYKWMLSYLYGYREVGKAEALDLGTSVHLTLEELLLMTKQGQHIEVGQALDILSINMDMADIQFASEEAEEDAINQHENMIAGLITGESKLAQFLEGKEIVATEKEFVYCINLPFSVQYKGEEYDRLYLIGAIDLIVKDSMGYLYVVDYKSGKKMFDNKKLQTNLQLPIYSLVILEQYKRLPTACMYYHTRCDEFQSVDVPKLRKEDVRPICYKNGKLKYMPMCIDDVKNQLIDIFHNMYKKGRYLAKDTPLCCWCQYHKRYGDGTCAYGNETYWRSDIEPVRT